MMIQETIIYGSPSYVLYQVVTVQVIVVRKALTDARDPALSSVMPINDRSETLAGRAPLCFVVDDTAEYRAQRYSIGMDDVDNIWFYLGFVGGQGNQSLIRLYKAFDVYLTTSSSLSINFQANVQSDTHNCQRNER